MATVPRYPGVVETSPDLTLENAKLAHPKGREELAAEEAVRVAQEAFDNFQRRLAKAARDIGEREGYSFGFTQYPSSFDVEREEVEHDLSRALVKLNTLRSARQGRIRAVVQAEEARQAREAQAVWRKRHGIATPDDEQPRRATVA